MSLREMQATIAAQNLELRQARHVERDLQANVGRLETAIKFEIDACFCDDRDGNCNPPAAPECERCQRLRAALAKP